MIGTRAFLLPLVTLLLAGTVQADSSWAPIGPPGNSTVTAIVTDADAIYAGTDGSGVLKTDDGGNTWGPHNLGLTSFSVRALLAPRSPHPGCPPSCSSPVFFAGTDGGGVFRDDFGSWVAVNNGLGSLSVTVLAAAQSSSLTIYAGTNGSGIFRSDDGGAHWVAASVGQPALAMVAAIAVAPTAPLTVYASGNGGGLFKTNDGGATWTRLAPALYQTFGSIAIDPGAPSTMYAAYKFPVCPSPCAIPPAPNAFRSSDGGATWEWVSSLADVRAFAFDSRRAPSTVYAGSGNGSDPGAVNRSDDGGATWSRSRVSGDRVDTLAVEPFTGTVFAGVPGQGVFVNGCVPSFGALCLSGGRFRVQVFPRIAGASINPVPITVNTGAFWFFSQDNLELVVKVLDGRAVNGKFWVFYGSLTNVQFTLTVTDTLTGAVKVYANASGQLASVADTSAF